MPSARQSVIFIGIIVVWLVVTACFIGFRPEHLWMALLLAVLFFYNASTRRFVLAMAPFAIFGISYDWMNLLPNYEVNPVDVGGLYQFEKSLFGITVAGGSVLTPNEFFALHTCTAADIAAGIFYLCWVPVPIAFGIWLYASGRRTEYIHFALVFLFVNLLGFLGYYIHPAAPPWYVSAFGADAAAIPGTTGQTAGLGAFDALTGLGIFDGLYSRNANVFAAVPSLHSAYVLVAFIYAIRSRSPKWLCCTLFIITAGIWWAAVYSSHHYLTDVILGIFTGILGVVIFEYLLMPIKGFARAIKI